MTGSQRLGDITIDQVEHFMLNIAVALIAFAAVIAGCFALTALIIRLRK